jgi:hypothetical protein
MRSECRIKHTPWSRILAATTIAAVTLACSITAPPSPTPNSTVAPSQTPIPTWTLTPQPTTGEISGQVIDSANGSPVPSANVYTNPPTVSVTADEQGRYSIPDVTPGVYTITAAKPGYTSASVSIAVAAGRVTTADIHLAAVPTNTPNPTAGAIPTDSLVAYYPFDGSADDASGNGNHGIEHGIKYTDGMVGQAAWFNGSDAYIDIPDNFFPQVTASALVRYERGYVPVNVEGYKEASIINAWRDAENFMLGIKETADGRVLFTGGFHDYEREDRCYYEVHVDSTTLVQRGMDYHAAVTYDGTTLRLYINGTLESQITTNKKDTYFCPTGPIPDIRIGVGRKDTGWFYGLIDEVRFYNRALSELEIQALYRQ